MNKLYIMLRREVEENVDVFYPAVGEPVYIILEPHSESRIVSAIIRDVTYQDLPIKGASNYTMFVLHLELTSGARIVMMQATHYMLDDSTSAVFDQLDDWYADLSDEDVDRMIERSNLTLDVNHGDFEIVELIGGELES